ncbi:MAG: sarcosine oxidase subunit delta [Anaerolineae bacterium]|nr:sarcosine oxidase subunit delta [Anaerolineae bacterium]
MVLLHCPNCGERNVSEFRFGGEYKARPQNAEAEAADVAWADYLYFKANKLGVQKEWWYHRAGCGLWFLAERHTKTHEIERTYLWGPGS